MGYDDHCSVRDGNEEIIQDLKIEQNDDASFTALFALVPATVMTLFSLIGLI